MTKAQTHSQVLLPIRPGLDPMESLLIASFEGDPEFEAIEPQVFDDPANGRGMRVLRYRKDGRVDVYWQSGVRIDLSTFTLGTGIGDFSEVAIEPSHFEIIDRGVDLHMAFTDAQGRKVELQVREGRPLKRGFPMLAPVGANIRDPLQFFLAYLPDLRFVPRAGSLVVARIGDRILRPATLPILFRGRRIWFIRYAARPVIGTLNPPAVRPLLVDLPMPGRTLIDGMSVVADEDGNITRIGTAQDPSQVEVDFIPGFPNLLALPSESGASGRWSIRIAGVPISGGSYIASREGGRVDLELDVTEPWKPSGLPFCMAIMVRLLRRFRAWPTSYRWRAAIELGPPPVMSGGWERHEDGGRRSVFSRWTRKPSVHGDPTNRHLQQS